MMTPGCHCLCHTWGHLGMCRGEGAETVRMPKEFNGRFDVDVRMCRPCAKDVRVKLMLVGAYA